MLMVNVQDVTLDALLFVCALYNSNGASPLLCNLITYRVYQQVTANLGKKELVEGN